MNRLQKCILLLKTHRSLFWHILIVAAGGLTRGQNGASNPNEYLKRSEVPGNLKSDSRSRQGSNN